MRLLTLLCAVMILPALEVPPPADPVGLGERLAMLDYLKEHGVKARTGLDDEAVRQLYSEAWQADPANRAELAVLLRDQAIKDRVRNLREAIHRQFGVVADAALDEDGLRALQTKLDGEMRDRLADQARESAARGELVLQRVHFTDGGTMLGLYDAVTGRIEVYDEKTGKRAGEMSLNRATVASVQTVTIPIRAAAAVEPAGAGADPKDRVPPIAKSDLPGANGTWITDPAEAKRSAAATHRPILMLFTGSDWCPWCVKLDDEVLRTKEFKDWAGAHAVLLYLDFPRKTPLSADQKLINKGLQEKYAVRGFPTVVFTDADGKALGQTGYQPGGPGAWIPGCNSIIGAR